ncbi:MAG: hypothetical protein IJ250_00930 [Bacteroidales bacterium]|nr:hypothetical protein [Bacteroidales bacterium]
MKIKKIISAIVISVFIIHGATGQQVDIDTYSFVDKNADTVVAFGQSQNQLKDFANKFSSMIKFGNRQMKILHIGDFHLQSDVQTGRIRTDFQSFMPGMEASRGMMPPYTKNVPDSYKITFSSAWKSFDITSTGFENNSGLWGTTAYTTAKENSITVNVNNKNAVKYDFNTVKIYHSPLNEGDNIILYDIPVAYQKIYNKEYGYTEFILADYVQEIKIEFDKTSTDIFYLYGFYFDNSNPGVVYNATSAENATCKSYLNAGKFFLQMESMNFDMIVISLGTNDVKENTTATEFEQNLIQLIEKIRQVNNDAPIVLTSPIESYTNRKTVNPHQQAAVDMVYNAAKRMGCAYINMYEVLGGKGSCVKMLNNGLMLQDRVHLTAKGYKLQGDLLFNALWDITEKNL